MRTLLARDMPDRLSGRELAVDAAYAIEVRNGSAAAVREGSVEVCRFHSKRDERHFTRCYCRRMAMSKIQVRRISITSY